MKNQFLRLLGGITFCFFFFSSSAQIPPKDLTAEKVKELLCHNWQITAQEVDGKKIPVPTGANAYMNFKKDGILTITGGGGPPEKATWSYQHDSSRIAFVLEGQKDAFSVINISSQDLMLLHNSEGYPIKLILKRSK